jgi:hypothetical protein
VPKVFWISGVKLATFAVFKVNPRPAETLLDAGAVTTLDKPLREGGPTKADELPCDVGEATLDKPLGDGGPTKALPCNTGELAAREADAKSSAFDKGAATLETSMGARPKLEAVNGPKLKLSAITSPSD